MRLGDLPVEDGPAMTPAPRETSARRSLPRMPHWLGKASGIATLALLSACASHQSNLPPSQQAAYYAAHSPGNYAPPGPPSDPWGPYIKQASARFDVPQRWIRQVMRVESGGQEYMNGHLTVSYAGAMGLMQLEPETYREMAARYGLGKDPFNPYNNIMAGTAYIHEMYEIYGSPGFLAAYNAGPGRLDDYLDYKEPLPDQTRQYVAMIAPNIAGVYPSGQSGGVQSGAVQVAMNTLPDNIAPGLRPGYDQSTTESLNKGQLAADTPPGSPAPQPAPIPPSAPIQMAALTPPPVVERPRYTPPITRSMPPVQRNTGFALMPTAEAAAPPPMPPAPSAETPSAGSSGTGSRWGIQVGAYDSPAHAKAALGIAELSAVAMLIKGQPVVQSVSTAHGLFYRARFVNLPHEQAVQACQRLNRGPTGCAVISPAAE